MTAAPWRIELARAAQRDLRRLDPPIRRRVRAALQTLAQDPRRALVLLDTEIRTIQVTWIVPRGRAYG